MSETLIKRADLLAFGFTVFTFYFGGANFIFPAWIGYAAGNHLLPASLSYIVTDTMLTMAVMIATVLNGSIWKLTSDLPDKLSLAFWFLLYLLIGLVFGCPRTAQVAYEIGVQPFLNPGTGQWGLPVFSFLYFAIVIWLANIQEKVITVIGKGMVPLLILVVSIVCGLLVLQPARGGAAPPLGDWQYNPLFEGMIKGYQTMDALGAPVFAIVTLAFVRRLTQNRGEQIIPLTFGVSLIAVFCLILVYGVFFYIGNSARELIPPVRDGAQVLDKIFELLLGNAGQVFLSIIVMIASLTTAVGVMIACSQFFHELMPAIHYQVILIVLCTGAWLVSIVGLNPLLVYAIPVVEIAFPLMIIFCLQTFLRQWLNIPRFAVQGCLLVAVVCIVLKMIENNAAFPTSVRHIYNSLPLVQDGLGWLAPALLTLGILTLGGKLIRSQSSGSSEKL